MINQPINQSINHSIYQSLMSTSQYQNIGGINDTMKLIESGIDIDTKYTDFQETILITAARCGRMDTVQYLVTKGANLNLTDIFGYTPLHEAAYRGHDDIAKYLLNHGADKSIVNRYHQTASFLAACHGRHVMAKYIEDFELIPTKGVYLDE
jgi:ankyrin repeat protein